MPGQKALGVAVLTCGNHQQGSDKSLTITLHRLQLTYPGAGAT